MASESSSDPSSSQSQRKRERVIFAIDVEARGQNMIKHGLNAIGYCVGRADRFEIMETGRFCLKPLPGQCYEPRCMDQFWSKYPDAKKKIEEEAVPVEDAIWAFREKIASLEALYDVSIVSDFAGFDFAAINYYLAYCGWMALHFTVLPGPKGEEFRPLYDTDGYSRGALGLGYENPWTSDSEVAERLNFSLEKKKTHLPDEDAASIYEVHIKTILGKQALLKRVEMELLLWKCMRASFNRARQAWEREHPYLIDTEKDIKLSEEEIKKMSDSE